jgi:hypothetical protein
MATSEVIDCQRTLFPEGEKSYNRKICAISTKLFLKMPHWVDLEMARVSKMPTFSRKTGKIKPGFYWQHNTITTGYLPPVIHTCMHEILGGRTCKGGK